MHLIYIILLLLISTTCLADTLEGKVVRIIDGDTLVILDSSNTQHRVRLAGIDTPERGQPFGKKAKENLARLAGGQPARLDWYKKDRWNRLIGKVWVRSPDSPCQGEDCPKTLNIGIAQLTQGLAWHCCKDKKTNLTGPLRVQITRSLSMVLLAQILVQVRFEYLGF